MVTIGIQITKIKPGKYEQQCARRDSNVKKPKIPTKPKKTPDRNLGLGNACQPVRNSAPVWLEIQGVLTRYKSQGSLWGHLFPPVVVCIKKFSLIVTGAKISHLSREGNMAKHRYFVIIHVLPYLCTHNRGPTQRRSNVELRRGSVPSLVTCLHR